MSPDLPLSIGHDAPSTGATPRHATSPRTANAGRSPSLARRRPADAIGDELSEERIAEIRARIASGAYNGPEVAAEIARRLLESGDLR